MINGNVLKFGYGDIVVYGNAALQRMSFQQFKPPTECGNEVSEDVEYIGDKILIDISYEDYCKLKNNLERVNKKEVCQFTFKDYIFDFSNYNVKSVNAVSRKLDACMALYFISLAA